jgi:peptide/nickel transport system substrate-binding protein
VTQLFAAIQPGIKPIDSFFTPAYPAGYSTAFSKYKPDLNMVNTLMTGDGWTKGADGVWAKAGKKAAVELKYTTGNKRRQLISQILQSEWQAAGFQLTITPEKSSVLFSTDLPGGTFQVALYAQTPSDDDIGQCNLWCSKNIPGPANGGNGTNYDRVTDPMLDQLWGDADSQIDPAKRLTDAMQGDARLADLVPALPLDPFPDIVIVHTDKLGVVGGTFQHNFAYGPYTYMNTWYMK